MDTISKKIAQARIAAGKSQSELARALNVKPQAVQKWENGGTPRNARMPEVAQALGVSVAYLLGEAGLEPARPDTAGISVPLLASDASMGPGGEPPAEDVLIGEIVLSEHFVRESLRAGRPEALRFIHAYGDSMAPTLISGDVLLVDTSAVAVNVDGIYVLRAHGRLFVKRVRQRLDGRYEISSDNPAHKTVELLNGDAEVTVVGRVIWYWNGHKVG